MCSPSRTTSISSYGATREHQGDSDTMTHIWIRCMQIEEWPGRLPTDGQTERQTDTLK